MGIKRNLWVVVLFSSFSMLAITLYNNAGFSRLSKNIQSGVVQRQITQEEVNARSGLQILQDSHQQRVIAAVANASLFQEKVLQDSKVLSDIKVVLPHSKAINKSKKTYELVGQQILARLEELDYEDIKLSGKTPTEKKFMTIAVPTVQRPRVGSQYLFASLESLFINSSPEDKQRMVVVVYLADKDPSYNQALLQNLTLHYPDYLASGFLNVIQAPSDFYPDFKNLKRNFGDSEDRVKWRSREVLDSAYMYYMCRNLSDYFIQLEDDVLSIPSYLKATEDYIKDRNRYTWAILDLSAHGSVGKLMKGGDLLKMAIFMFTFYEEQPVDWLMTHFRQTLAQKDAYVRRPIIFQHMGKMSSFNGNGVRAIPKVQSHFKQEWNDVKR